MNFSILLISSFVSTVSALVLGSIAIGAIANLGVVLTTI
jgi:hypothetical protein